MARILYYIFFMCILFGFAYTTSPGPRCLDPNKVYECHSDWDTRTCEDKDKSPPFAPTPQNVCRCYCNRGLYQNDDGDCVTYEECPRCLDRNKVYECHSDWDTRTCEDKDKSPPFAPTPQNVCRCYCNRGLYQNDDGDCVTYEECL